MCSSTLKTYLYLLSNEDLIAMTAIPQHFHFDPPIKMTPKIDDIIKG